MGTVLSSKFIFYEDIFYLNIEANISAVLTIFEDFQNTII